MTWGELRAAAADQGVDLNGALRSLLERMRDASEALLLLGFPIPATVGGPLETVFGKRCACRRCR